MVFAQTLDARKLAYKLEQEELEKELSELHA